MLLNFGDGFGLDDSYGFGNGWGEGGNGLSDGHGRGDGSTPGGDGWGGCSNYDGDCWSNGDPSSEFMPYIPRIIRMSKDQIEAMAISKLRYLQYGTLVPKTHAIDLQILLPSEMLTYRKTYDIVYLKWGIHSLWLRYKTWIRCLTQTSKRILKRFSKKT